MNLTHPSSSVFTNHQVLVDGLSIHVVEAGKADRPAILFLHGFPENWSAFEQVMALLYRDFRVVAIDLPGVGTTGSISSTSKTPIARLVKRLVDNLRLHQLTLVGHDMGGMVTYAYLHTFPNTLENAIIMNTAIPGIDPWEEVKRNPNIWHFAFHNVPELPEMLVGGKERVYFEFFFNAISAHPEKINKRARSMYADAYAKPESLRTAFNWYRSFTQDEKDNRESRSTIVETPVLYIRGDKEYGDINTYLKGFRNAGLTNIEGKVIEDCGHFSPDEQPEKLAEAIREMLKVKV
ncbi:alpha/beta fold hydrolase [Chryseolinea soli]|uniref:Alpha/beta hydrolase n=1 Tax=Chryseolinea soli TaxID=2321403 RepID=A0A385SR18_9BACT|nr:alpha/beta hydrolase [Chryseolinea soli]AYB33006.1 alpha/beta hydrolase [Chryseolinea soli]